MNGPSKSRLVTKYHTSLSSTALRVILLVTVQAAKTTLFSTLYASVQGSRVTIGSGSTLPPAKSYNIPFLHRNTFV